jgi:hypothetical protein
VHGMGGTLDVGTAPGEGLTLRAVVPMKGKSA